MKCLKCLPENESACTRVCAIFPWPNTSRHAFWRTDTSTSFSTTNISFKFRSIPGFTFNTRWMTMCKCDGNGIDAQEAGRPEGFFRPGSSMPRGNETKTHVVPVTWRPPTGRRGGSDERRFAPGGIGDAPLLTSCSPAGGPVSGPHSSEGWDVAIHGGL